MSLKRVNILGTRFHHLTRTEAVDRIAEHLQSGSKASVFTPNPEIVIEACNNPEFESILNSSELVLADGIGVVIGSRIIGHPLPERVAGYDTLLELFDKIMVLNQTCYWWALVRQNRSIGYIKTEKKSRQPFYMVVVAP